MLSKGPLFYYLKPMPVATVGQTRLKPSFRVCVVTKAQARRCRSVEPTVRPKPSAKDSAKLMTSE